MGVTGTMRGAALRAKATTSVSGWLVVAEQKRYIHVWKGERQESYCRSEKSPTLNTNMQM